ncbi:MAG: pectin acetylesterase-family hydrolase, partial [Myxococcota bacterium]
LAGSVVRDTVVAPGLDDSQYTTLSPGPTDYLGRTYTPQCVQGSEYRYFARRGSENKLLIYYQGGGACWNGLTCGIPTCRAQPNDNLDEFAAEGFFDLSDERNPFRNWNVVFVTYCSCDIHFGDASVTYDEDEEPTQHLGFHNAKVVEKWAREHFLNPEVVFVTGSSAGAYGAWFHGPLLHDVWPASQMHILADAGNGVITEDFLENEFSVWNFVPNLADVPGAVEAITEGGGMPAYSEAVATAFPNINWAHYTAFYDGSPGGQSGFYNVMLNDGSPAGTALWWEAVCEFGDLALQQSEQTFAAVPENYRYYFGSGTEHTVFRFPKVYTDTAGGVPLLVDWVTAMLNSGPDDKDPAWANVLCEDCGVLLESDPRPAPLQPPFIEDGPITQVVCD